MRFLAFLVLTSAALFLFTRPDLLLLLEPFIDKENMNYAPAIVLVVYGVLLMIFARGGLSNTSKDMERAMERIAREMRIDISDMRVQISKTVTKAVDDIRAASRDSSASTPSFSELTDILNSASGLNREDVISATSAFSEMDNLLVAIHNAATDEDGEYVELAVYVNLVEKLIDIARAIKNFDSVPVGNVTDTLENVKEAIDLISDVANDIDLDVTIEEIEKIAEVAKTLQRISAKA